MADHPKEWTTSPRRRVRPKPEPWNCQGCGSANASHWAKCPGCGKPRH